jgi:hypothetical protein
MWEPIAIVMAALISGVVGPLIIWHYKESQTNEQNKDRSVDDEVKFSRNLTKELEKIRKEVKADRIWIAQFHNGGRFLGSLQMDSMKRISVTHEVVAAGVSREQSSLSGVLVSFFSEMINDLLNEDHKHYTQEHVKNDPEIELLFRQRGTEKMHVLAMRDIEGTLIGILGVDYVENPPDLSDEETQYLGAKAKLLAGYIFYGITQKT